MTVHRMTGGRRRLPSATACMWLALAGAAHAASDLPHPADPAAPAPPVNVPDRLGQESGSGLGAVDAPRLPWTRLYRSDGSFVPEEALRTGTASAPPPTSMPGHDHGTMGSGAAPGAHGMSMSTAGSAPPSDARGVIRAIDREQGKLTLKHGPIERLEMPGMTMIFRVRDASVLDGFAAGDEVGFDVEIDGTTFYVTRISR